MTAKKKEMQTVLVSYEQWCDPEFNPPSRYFIRVCSGDFLFFKSNKRSAIQEYINEEYGGLYVIRSM